MVKEYWKFMYEELIKVDLIDQLANKLFGGKGL
jgi:hypothetical protein